MEMEKDSVTLEDVRAAAKRIAPYTVHTPMLRGASLDAILGCEVYLKPETLQVSGAFKMRGATNAFLNMTEEEKKRGAICLSAGNHGKACATIGQKLGVHVTVVMPDDAPKAKVEGIRKVGGEAILTTREGSDRGDLVQKLIKEKGYVDIHPTDNVYVVAGQGTCGLEIMEDLPDVDTIIVPVGGAGLISGVALTAKTIRPQVKVIGIQSKANDAFTQSWQAGKPLDVGYKYSTIADGLGCIHPGEICYPLAMKYVDAFYSVGEEEIAEATRLLAAEAKLMGEPSACVGMAAVMTGLYRPQPGEKVCFLLSAGNWDIDRYGRLLAGEGM